MLRRHISDCHTDEPNPTNLQVNVPKLKGLDSRIYDVHMWVDNPIGFGALSLSM